MPSGHSLTPAPCLVPSGHSQHLVPSSCILKPEGEDEGRWACGLWPECSIGFCGVSFSVLWVSLLAVWRLTAGILVSNGWAQHFNCRYKECPHSGSHGRELRSESVVQPLEEIDDGGSGPHVLSLRASGEGVAPSESRRAFLFGFLGLG